MPNRMRLKAAGLLAPVGLMAAVAAIAMPASSSLAASGSQVITANVALACTLAPGVLNVKGTVNATLSGTVPTSVNPGDSVSLTNVTTSLTTPAAWSSSFASLGAATASGSVTSFVLDGVGTNPATLNAASPALPFGPVTVVSGQPLSLSIPNTGPFSVGPITVTGAAGSNLVLSIDSAANGIVANASGYDSSNSLVVGPLTIDCTAPAGSTLGSVPIVAPVTSTTTTASTTPTTTSTTTHSTTSTTSSTSHTTTTSVSTTATSTTTPVDTVIKFNNWVLTGSLTPHKLGQKIAFPSGSTFNGSADLTKGTVTGDIKIPKFSAKISILGIPTTVGLTVAETGPVTGTLAPDPNVSGNLVFKATAKANIGISAVGILGINIPTSCTTSSAVSFPLSTSAPALSLTTGVSFSGTTTLPSVKCGGILGGLLSPVLTALFSGPNNSFSLAIAPPA